MTATDFDSIKSFVDVPITEDGVDTVSFLDASDGLVNLFDLLGSAVFGFVQTDLRANIAGVRERYNAHPDVSTTLEKLVTAEKAGGVAQSPATACLGRLLRGLAFTCRALQTMLAERSITLYDCFRRAYDDTLGRHHGFLVRKVVGVAIRAIPLRPEFYARISGTEPGDTVAHDNMNAKLTLWLDALEKILRHMKVWLEEKQWGKVTM